MHNKSVEEIAKILVDKGYIESYNVIEDGVKKTINVVLKYDENNKSVINELKRRVYKGSKDIKRFKNGYGTIIVS